MNWDMSRGILVCLTTIPAFLVTIHVLLELSFYLLKDEYFGICFAKPPWAGS